MTSVIRWLCLLLLWTPLPAFGDEQVRQVQEELRRRNLYFGDVDGQTTPDLAGALKRYQARKGFPVTGQIDELTAASLNLRGMGASSKAWPEGPVLKSDAARELSDSERAALQTQAEENPDLVPTPAPPAESPAPSQNLSPERVGKLVEEYLRDAEGNDIAAQTSYFAYPVDYFDHGPKGAQWVEKDVLNYLKRWPERKYLLTEPVTFVASGNEDETIVEFPIAFTVRNGQKVANGRTKNIWTIRPEGNDLKIIGIREQRLRE
jgi:peptidoglycan hydrolase-like protein with peptidoglycan-binding domain